MTRLRQRDPKSVLTAHDGVGSSRTPTKTRSSDEAREALVEAKRQNILSSPDELFEVLKTVMTQQISNYRPVLSRQASGKFVAKILTPSDYPRFRHFVTRISTDLQLETEFIKTWLAVARESVVPSKIGKKTQGMTGPESRRYVELVLNGMQYFIEDNLKLLDDLSLFRTDENWSECHPRTKRIVRDVDWLDANTAWRGRLLPIVSGLRESRQKRVNDGDNHLACRMLEEDVTWLGDPTFQGFLNQLWMEGISESWSRSTKDLKIEVQYWFRLRKRRDQMTLDNPREQAVRAAIFEFATNEVLDPTGIAAKAGGTDYGLNYELSSIEKFIRLANVKNRASVVKDFMKSLLGKAMMKTALRTPCLADERTREKVVRGEMKPLRRKVVSG